MSIDGQPQEPQIELEVLCAYNCQKYLVLGQNFAVQ